MSLPACVITTINRPTRAIRALKRLFPEAVIVVGDQKTPIGWNVPSVQFLSTEKQVEMSDYLLPLHLPFNHYARKNLGYLKAFESRPPVIYDTDDDNIPNADWSIRNVECFAQAIKQKGWCNVYSLFHVGFVWPRGFPLEHIWSSDRHRHAFAACTWHSPIQQGLANGSPDVDAIWRLLTAPNSVTFEKRSSILLRPGTWCPFNSQSTWWWPEAYPLMYLPVNATFRMTDIWRSFVAQRCLWEMGYGVTFHSPAEVTQKRNPHSLLRDFEDEVPGYLNNAKIAATLQKLRLSGNIFKHLFQCYEALVAANFLPSAELESVDRWIIDYENACGNLRKVQTPRVLGR
jgi:hypothetical protein